MYKALIIGCGNIGGLYDINSQNILSHAKAYYTNENFTFEVYDSDTEKTKIVSQKYNAPVLKTVTHDTLKQYDIVSICSPTSTHYTFLSQCLEAGVPSIICEKPITYSSHELKSLKEKYKKANTSILVNYIRRFSTGYGELKDTLKKIRENEILQYINIRYNRGFLNNCSHAFDTIEYLLDIPIDLEELKILHYSYDFFEKDPTLSLVGKYNQAELQVIGYENINYSTFEIDLLFSNTYFRIMEGGNKINILKEGSTIMQCNDLLKNYMKPVINSAHEMCRDRLYNDNFESSIEINANMLNILKLI